MLAASGQLSLAVSNGILELAELLMLAPAACLDYFDAQYTKSDADGEYAGFSISGHLLRNESVVNRVGAEYKHLPLMLTQPLAIIQVGHVRNMCRM